MSPQRGLTWNNMPLPLRNPWLWRPRCLWSFHCLLGGASPARSALNIRPYMQTHSGHECNVYIGCSSNTRRITKYTLLEASTPVVILRQLLFILAGGSFLTFSSIFSHSFLTSNLRRTKYFSISSIHFSFAWVVALKSGKLSSYWNAETNWLTCPIRDNHAAEDVF